MPRMYPATVRRQIVARLRSGEPVAAVAAETGVRQAYPVSVEAPGTDRCRRYRGHSQCGGRRAGAAHKRIAQTQGRVGVDTRRVRTLQCRGGGAPKTPTRDH